MGTVQDVRIARRTGFCYGVREAIDKAKEASAAGKATHTLRQVVHNEGVVNDLQRLGIKTVDTLDDVDHGSAVVIRAHGVRPDVMARANERGQFRITGLPPDERYFAVAVDFLEEGEEQDPQFLERLRSQAMTFSLREGEQRSIYLDPIAP